MDYEKEYKSLVAKVKKAHQFAQTDSTKSVLEDILPQLRESEDKRIREAIESVIRVYGKTQGNWIAGYDMDTLVVHLRDAFAWLEKQKEQKSLNISAASEWLRKHVCNYVNSEYNEFHKCVEYDGSIDKERLVNDFEEAMQKDQKPSLCDKCEKKPTCLDTKYGDDRAVEQCINFVEKKQKPAEWSEEDEDMLNSCISSIEEAKENRYAYKETDGDTSYDLEISFLKSLRPQPRWKPSEEQTGMLLAVINEPNNAGAESCHLMLQSLYVDLQKLL